MKIIPRKRGFGFDEPPPKKAVIIKLQKRVSKDALRVVMEALHEHLVTFIKDRDHLEHLLGDPRAWREGSPVRYLQAAIVELHNAEVSAVQLLKETGHD